MPDGILAAVEVRAYLTLLVLAPAASRAEGSRGLLDAGEVVAVSDFFIDEVVAEGTTSRVRWSAQLARSVARHDELFHALFG